MSDKSKDGGSAFPRPTHVELDDSDTRPAKGNITGDDGMSLRDWFAGQALAGLLAKHGTNYFGWTHTEGLNQTAQEQAYKHADAMLAERAKDRTA